MSMCACEGVGALAMMRVGTWVCDGVCTQCGACEVVCKYVRVRVWGCEGACAHSCVSEGVPVGMCVRGVWSESKAQGMEGTCQCYLLVGTTDRPWLCHCLSG